MPFTWAYTRAGLCAETGRGFHLPTDNPTSDWGMGLPTGSPRKMEKCTQVNMEICYWGEVSTCNYVAVFYELSLYKAINEAFHQYMTMAVSQAAFLAE